jgi:signal transduction histidine kinase
LSHRLLTHLRHSNGKNGTDWEQLCVAHTAKPQFLFELSDETVRLRLLATSDKDQSSWQWNGHEWQNSHHDLTNGKPEILDDPRLEAVQGILAAIRRDDLRACDVISRLRELLGNHAMRRQPVDLGETVAEALQILAAEARRRGVGVTLARSPAPVVEADRVQVQQVVVNLVLNALDAVTSTSWRPPCDSPGSSRSRSPRTASS